MVVMPRGSEAAVVETAEVGGGEGGVRGALHKPHDACQFGALME